ncbi:hypothetical protein KGD82_03895 [Nocardiopsis eucommiae]|uniref:Protein kinase domain-containing protein n=1 Tax=Nocardiopsis eucommiae TaxID=2831970 RepID=A0A975L9P0_9ACTN|nr:hypothetical protein KGD82_03895 [Nocardiopsis eucommiae]
MNPSAGPSAAAPTPDRDHLPPGVERPAKGDPAVLGDHRVIGRVSRDAAGTVLLGTDTAGAASVIRVVPARLADAPEARARLEAEVDRLSRVRSLCAVAYRGADVRAAEPWLASAHAPGLTLAAHVAEHGPLTGGMLSALAAGVAEALAAGHAAGALHLALDPSRVIMSPEGPRVVDLGTVRATGQPLSPRGGPRPSSARATPPGSPGTPTCTPGVRWSTSPPPARCPPGNPRVPSRRTWPRSSAGPWRRCPRSGPRCWRSFGSSRWERTRPRRSPDWWPPSGPG